MNRASWLILFCTYVCFKIKLKTRENAKKRKKTSRFNELKRKVYAAAALN